MSKEEKIKKDVEPKEKELSLEELENVSGGSLGNLPKRETVDISDSVKKRI